MASDDHVLTTMRFIPHHKVVQKYSAILPDNLTNQSMKESEAYKTYYAFATRKEIPKPKYVHRSVKEKTKQAPKASFGKRIKSTAKVTRLGKKKQIVKGLETFSQPSGSGTHEGTGVTPGVPDVPTYESDDEQISWKSSDDEDDETSVSKDEGDDDQEDDDDHEDDDDQGDDDGWTDPDNDGDDFLHLKFSTHDQDERQDEEDSFDPRVQTPSYVETKEDEENQDVNVEGDELDEEETNEEDKRDELYRDVNINLEGRDIVMTDAQQTNVQTTQMFWLLLLLSHLFLSATTLPPPPTPLITHLQQTPVPAPTTVPSSSLQDLPNFGSLFEFDDRQNFLEIDFSEFKQTNQFAEAVSSIPSIVDLYLANKMNESIKTVV
nr:hypothetical protein [Tanacetum cinerariifolium]